MIVLARGKWWLGASVGVCLLLSAAASASAPRAGAHRAGKVHVVAVRRQGHLVWLSRSAQQWSRRSLTLSRATRFAQHEPRTASSVPTITVTGLGFPCSNPPYSNNTYDTAAWVESYAPSLYSDMATCQGNDGVAAQSHQELPNPVGCAGWGGVWKSQSTSPTENAQFSDGEWIAICNVPDDNGSGGSNANNSPYTFYQQGFRCGAVAGVGSSDSTVYRAKTNDSIELYQNYVDYNGNSTQAITTSCLGVLPSSVTVSSSPVANFVACYQYNPNGGSTVLGYGETVTYPDRQWSETCTTPNYHPSPALT